MSTMIHTVCSVTTLGSLSWIACSAWPSRPTSTLTNMFPAFVQHVSTGFADFDEFDGHLTTSPWRHLSMPLSQPSWTIATWFSLVHQGLSLRYWMPRQQVAEVPDRLLCSSLGYRWSSATALSTPSPAGCTALSTNYTWPLGVLCRWTNRLEFASSRAQRWDWEHFSAVTENTAFQTILVCSAH